MAEFRYPVSRPYMEGKELLYVAECFKTNWLTHGPMVEKFEEQFAKTVGAKFAVACSSGTAALHLALVALGIGHGHEVIVPDLSFVATANAVTYTGAKPVLVDVDPATWCMDLVAVEAAITPRTVAVMPVHLYGNAANLLGLRLLCSKYRLSLIEDAAEGLGGKYENKALGTHGTCGCFSFYGNKIVTTGEGGMVVTDEPYLLQQLKHYRGQAQTTRYMHTNVGFNYRMTSMQAAVGLGQLENFATQLATRMNIFRWYDHHLAGMDLIFPVEATAPWLYSVVLPEWLQREKVEQHLAAAGIETRPFFVPMHQLPMYKRENVEFPVATRLGRSGISLPTYVGLTQADVKYVSRMLSQVLAQAA